MSDAQYAVSANDPSKLDRILADGRRSAETRDKATGNKI